MHSSRMRTARSLTVSHSICQGGMHAMHAPCHTCPPPCTPPAMHIPCHAHPPSRLMPPATHSPPPHHQKKEEEDAPKELSKISQNFRTKKGPETRFLVVSRYTIKTLFRNFAPSYNFFYFRNLKEEKKF